MSSGPVHLPPQARLSLWWLSFVDPDRAAPRGQQVPGGPGFLGVAIVEATDLMSAVRLSHERGCNPGGEVQAFGPLPREGIPEQFWHRVLSQAEAEAVPDPWETSGPGAGVGG